MSNVNVLNECDRCLIVHDGCRSIWCSQCGPSRGRKLRKRLIARYEANSIESVGFATLTCNPAILGSDLQSQFDQVKERRLVSRFVKKLRKLLGVQMAYFSIMEFHKQSQQIHFHLALDGLGRLPKSVLCSLQTWCQRHMGTFDYKFMPSFRAVSYCLKYLTKAATDPLPEWCLDYEGRILPYTASRGFWHDKTDLEPAEPTGKSREQRTLRQRFHACEKAGVTIIKETAAPDGSVNRQYVTSWPCSIELVAYAINNLLPDDLRDTFAKPRRSLIIAWNQLKALTEHIFGPVIGAGWPMATP